MDGNLMNMYLKKYGLKIRTASRDLEREEAHKESLPLWSGTVSQKKKPRGTRRNRKRKERDDSSSKSRQKYSTNKQNKTKENMEDFCPSHKYFSNSGTHKVNFKKKKPSYVEHEKSCCKFNQKKKNYLKAGSSVVKILDEKKRSERKKTREKNKCSRETSQGKMINKMRELKKISETQEETACSEHFSEQHPKNVSKTFPTIYTCQNKSNDNKSNGILTNREKQFREMNEECSQFKEVGKESKEKVVEKVSQTEMNDELCIVDVRYADGRYESRICDPHHISSRVKNEALKTDNLSLNEDEYDSREEDSEDDKETVIFDEKFSTLGKLKECSEKVSECKQQNVQTNIKGGKLKSLRRLKRTKPSLVKITKKKEMIIRKKLWKPTRKIRRKASKRCQIEKSNETITRSNKFVEKFEDILTEVSNLVKHLHETHKVIVHLKKDMGENEKLAEHFKTVIEAQQENYRKEIWRNQETIMKGYDKMMSHCKKSSTVSLEISNRTFLSVEEVENVLSRCILVENALEVLKSTQTLSAVEKNVSNGSSISAGVGISSCLEKERFTGIVATSGDSSEIIGKEPHIEIISLDDYDGHLAPQEGLRISNNLYPDNRVTPLAKNLTFSSLISPVPCPKERHVIPLGQSTGEHSEVLVLRQSQSHESNHAFVPYQNSQKSRVNFINQDRGQDHRLNLTEAEGFSIGSRRSDFIQHDKPREDHIKSASNVQNQVLVRQTRHCLHEQHLTKSSPQFPTNGSVQQILVTKRPPRPQNPIPRVFQPEVEMNSNSIHQPIGFMNRPSVQRRINIETNLAVPFNPATRDSFNQNESSYLIHCTKSNPGTFSPYTPIRGITRPLASRNNMTNASRSIPPQKVIPSHFSQFSTNIPIVSNTSSMSTSPSARTHTSTMPGSLRELRSPPSPFKNSNNETESGLRVSNSMQNIPSPMRSLHPVARSSGLGSNLAVGEQCYFSKANERALQAFRENKNSAPYVSCNVPGSSTVQESQSESQVLDPTIPQKLTMKNHRLQAGAILMPSTHVTQSKSQPDEDQVNRVIKVEIIDLQEEEKMPETQKIARGLSSRKYECAQNGCDNSGIRICKGCESIIYCSGTCQLNHWKQKHKEECTKLRELRPVTNNNL